MEPQHVVPGPIIEPRWLDVDTAAQYLCMSRHAIYHRISRRQIPFVRRGRIIRLDRQALDRWMSKGVRNGLRKQGGIWYFRKTINGQLFRESTGFADKKSAERHACEIEHDIRAGIHGWKSTIPSFADWWA